MNRFRLILKSQRGVGLLEVMISMILLAVGVLGMGLMIATAIQGNVTSRDNTVVTALLKQRIESVESLDSLPPVPIKTEETGLEGGIYNRTTYVIDNTVDTTIPDGLYYLEVEVTWQGQDELGHARRFSTYIQKH